MKPPAFTPPYDSPIEHDFAYQFVKHLDERVDFQPQYHIDTLCGHFIVDFVAVSADGLRVGFECDGKAFHDPARDEWRDAMIIGSGALDVIYRLTGKDLTFQLDNVLFLLSRCEPTIFSARGIANLKSLANYELRDFEACSEETDFYRKLYEPESGSVNHIYIERRHKIMPSDRPHFWQSAYNFAVSQGGGSLDEIIALYRSSGV